MCEKCENAGHHTYNCIVCPKDHDTGKYPKVLSWKLDSEPSVSVTNAQEGKDDDETMPPVKGSDDNDTGPNENTPDESDAVQEEKSGKDGDQ